MYRFLYRALQYWPDQRPLTPLVHLWLSVIAPWWPCPNASPQQQSSPWQAAAKASNPQGTQVLLMTL